METQEGGWNQVVGADTARIVAAAQQVPTVPELDPGVADASKRIAQLLQQD